MPPERSPRVLIAGGGIGGLAAGLALQQRGIEAVICERASALHEVGAGLLLSPNAVGVLALLGLAEAATARSRVIEEWRILDARGRRLHKMRPARAGHAALSLHRGDLQSLLLSQLDPRALHLGFEVAGYAEHADRVELRATSGARIAGTLLVGADGLHSQVRTQRLRDGPARACGYAGWRCVVPWVPDGYEGAWLSESWGEGKRFGISPLGGNRCYWYATANRQPGDAHATDARAGLLAMFQHWHAPIPEMIAATRPETILQSDIHDRPDGPAWTQDRVTLLGDAAHPMSPNLGQGACTALEDAWVLGRELAGAPDKLDGLRRYERARHGRTGWINRASRLLGHIIQLEHPAATAARDAILRATPGPCSDWCMRPLFRFQG